MALGDTADTALTYSALPYLSQLIEVLMFVP